MEDEKILELYRSGLQEQAFREIVKEYSERLYWHVRGLIGSHDETDDLLQEIFIKIWAALPSFRGESRLFTWLYRIATNESLNWLQKQRVRAALRFESLSAAAELKIDNDPYFDGDKAERLLSKAVAKLPPKQKAVFNMRYYDELSYEEISEILGSSVSSLKASYHFAQEKVRKELEEKS